MTIYKKRIFRYGRTQKACIIPRQIIENLDLRVGNHVKIFYTDAIRILATDEELVDVIVIVPEISPSFRNLC